MNKSGHGAYVRGELLVEFDGDGKIFDRTGRIHWQYHACRAVFCVENGQLQFKKYCAKVDEVWRGVCRAGGYLIDQAPAFPTNTSVRNLPDEKQN